MTFSIEHNEGHSAEEEGSGGGDEGGYAWALHDGCIDEVVAECPPCVLDDAARRQMSHGDFAMHMRKAPQGQEGGAIAVEAGPIVPMTRLAPDKEYVLEVRPARSDESCCGLSGAAGGHGGGTFCLMFACFCLICVAFARLTLSTPQSHCRN